MSLEREIACDDSVLRRGSHRQAYALLLVHFADHLQPRPVELALAVSATKSQLAQRIHMILNTRRNTEPALAKHRLGYIASGMAVLAASSLLWAPRFVPAQNESSPPKNKPAADEERPQPGVAPAANPAGDSLPGTPVSPPGGVNGGLGVALPRVPPQPGFPAPPAAALPTPRQPGQYGTLPPGDPFRPTPPDGVYPPPPLEQRLERLERMVQSLLAQQRGLPQPPGQAQPEAGLNNDARPEIAQRKYEEARARALGQHREGFARELENLRAEREQLQRQLERVQQEMERLERVHRKFEQDHQPDRDPTERQPAKR